MAAGLSLAGGAAVIASPAKVRNKLPRWKGFRACLNL